MSYLIPDTLALYSCLREMEAEEGLSTDFLTRLPILILSRIIVMVGSSSWGSDSEDVMFELLE